MSAPNMTLAPRCGLCSGKEHLLRCARCRVMLYCSKEHQTEHRDAHKSACNGVKKARDHMEKEEAKLRAHPGDKFMAPDPFTSSVGHFWGIHETRDYMRARFGLIEALLKIKTFDAVQAALAHLMDMLRLCRGDNLGVRDLVPAQMLRLGKDQECYDFVKWYATMGNDSDYDWGDMDLPFLDVKNADVFEPVGYMCKRFVSSLAHILGIALLKIKLLLDLKNLQNSAVLGQRVPQEILDGIQDHLLRSKIISENKGIMDRTDHAVLIKEMSSQVDEVYTAVESANKHIWKALLKPTGHLNARPESYSHGSVQEMQIVLKYSLDAWIETPGALDLIRAKVEG
jgi:hypothetical protein